MSPAEQLRAAAAKLRDTAAKATPGPWSIFTDTGADFDLYWVQSERHGPVTAQIDDCGVCVERSSSEGGRADASWIAMMSPARAEPLAAWLEGHADDHGAYDCTWDESDCPALALARVILGEAP